MNSDLIKSFEAAKSQMLNPVKKDDLVLRLDSQDHLPRSRLHYDSIVDVVNYKGFTGWYDPSYMPMPTYFTQNNMEPLYNPSPYEGHSYGIMTIANMIHMHTLNMEFRLERDEDMDLVVIILRQYLDYIGSVKDNRRIEAYRKQAMSFLDSALKVQARMHRRTGKALPGSVAITNILSKLLG